MIQGLTRRQCLESLAGASASAMGSSSVLSEEIARRALRAADRQAFDYPTVQALLFIDQYLRANTENRRSLQIFADGQLGEDDETIEQTRRGAIDISRVNATPMSSYVPACQLFTIPFLIKSDAHLNRVLESKIGEDILAGFEAHGLVGLGFYNAGARSFFNAKHPIRTPQDLAGLRIRVDKSRFARELLRAAGGDPVDLSYSHVRPALQAGLIDGAEDNLPSYVTTDNHLAARFLTLTQHAWPPEILLMSARSWDALDPREKRLMREAVAASTAFFSQRIQDWTEIARQQAAAEGVDLSTDFDEAGFQALFRPVTDRLLQDPDLARLSNRIQDLG